MPSEPSRTVLRTEARRLAAVASVICLVSAAAVVVADKDDRQDARRRLNDLQRDQNAIQRELNETTAELKRLRPAHANDEKAYRAATDRHQQAKAAETQVLQRLKAEIERDPRPSLVRKELTEAQDAEQKLRKQLMSKLESSKEYEEHRTAVASLQARIEQLQADSPRDPEAIAKAANAHLEATHRHDDYLEQELAKDATYVEAREALDSAKAQFVEVEREITQRIDANPERLRLGQAAGQAMSDYQTAFRQFQDATRRLSAAESRLESLRDSLSRVNRDIADARRDADRNNNNNNNNNNGRRN